MEEMLAVDSSITELRKQLREQYREHGEVDETSYKEGLEFLKKNI